MTSKASATLIDALREQAAARPEHEALRFLGDGDGAADTLTYRQLETRARSVAALLQSHAAPGDRAVLLLPSGLDYIAGFYGCLFAGIIAVPAYPPESTRPRHFDRLRVILEDAAPALILAAPSLCETIQPMVGDRARLLFRAGDEYGVG